ncbi:MAG: UDP-N-acetylglucosamine diphosphorylase/glucosamine-1-phosphate N-acetyltransferase [Chloroflexi bacterium RBG_16_54_18]|nr:MAG: UDP-N-acetylglucosamine diphosphorylase/glucosamine-1-phosphate N-acetyltransferase [Chloroflexi bacterium RBG_16_54_18]
MKIAGVILAAGQGTRMKSTLPKVLHPVMGKPMIHYSIDTVTRVTGKKPYTVVGFDEQMIRQQLGDKIEYIIQDPQLGTGHALQTAAEVLQGKSDYILVTLADMPLIRQETMQAVVDAHVSGGGPITMLTVRNRDARGFGRVLRNTQGEVLSIVEEAQATQEQLQIEELNTSVYCFTASWLWQALDQIPMSPKGEYYLTDLMGIAVAGGKLVQTVALDDPVEAIGVNSRDHLAEVTYWMKKRINMDWMLSGVTIIDPDSTYIEGEVEIGTDSVIWPNTYLTGKSVIGKGCQVGPNAVVRNTQLGNRSKVVMSVLEEADVDEDVDIGPFAHLRKGARIGKGVHIGNFGEIKNSVLGEGTKMGHFSYIGDATIGPEVNIGAGTITCNFDGEKKNHTEIEEGAFIGSDTMLVAPVKIGKGARTGAGSVVTRDVPADTLAVGMPARMIKKLNKSD